MARKQGLNGFRPKVVSLAVASCFAVNLAYANPTGPTVVNGTAAILQNGNLLQITNSPNAIINWQSFSIGVNEITRFIQQSQASAVLNRVVGSGGAIDPSVILGALQSNGRVFLINPSGILFGAGAQVDVAGLVATSLNLSNADFLANRLKFGEVTGAGSVVNQGNITAGPGGAVYLVGPAVTNNGIITSPQGEVVLAAGNSVELVNPGTPNLRVEITAPDNQAVNLGQVVAESGRVGIYAGLIRNAGTVSASSAVAEGGKILLKATKNVTLESSSILDASGVGGGTIEVLAKNGGTVNVAGRLDASAPVSGNGGFIETSADKVKVADGTVVRAGAANGKGGMWLIDPTDLTIAAYGGDMTGSSISSTLAYGTSVTLTSDVYGGTAGFGDIHVNDSISWSTSASLSLVARRDVNVNSPITSSYGGPVSLYAGWDGADPYNPSLVANTGTITVDAPIMVSAGGPGPSPSVLLNAGKDIVVNAAGSVTAYTGDGVTSIEANAGRNISIAGSVLSEGAYGASVSLNAANDINVTGSVSAPSLLSNVSSASVYIDAGHDVLVDGGTVTAASYYGGQANVYINADNIVTAQGEANIAASSSGYSYVEIYGQNGITVDNSNISATSSGYYSYVNLSADGAGAQVNILNNSTISANQTGSSYSSWVSVWADGAEGAGTGKINVTDSNISSFAAYGGSAEVTLTAGQEVKLDNSTLAANSYGGSAYINLYANGPAGEINVVNGSQVLANGYYYSDVFLGADGGEGSSSAGKIKIENSTVSASTSEYEAYVTLSAGSGGITVDGAEGVVQAQSSNGYAETWLTTTGAIKVGMGAAGSTVRADGAEGAAVGLMAQGNIDVKGSLINAVQNYSYETAYVSLNSGGNITLDGATVRAEALSNDYYSEAIVSLTASGAITLQNETTVTAATNNWNGTAVVGMQAGGAISLTGSTVDAAADGGEGRAIVGFSAGTDITLIGGLVTARTANEDDGPSLVGMIAGNNITIQGNVTSLGLGYPTVDGCECWSGQGWFNPFIPLSILNSLPGSENSNFTGIAMQAGNKIIGGTPGSEDGILTAPQYQTIALGAMNGIGTQALPVRINMGNEEGPDIYLQNAGATGDIAVSFATGDVIINDDVYGIFNNNPTGTFFINAEAGNFELNAPFKPGNEPGVDLGSQSLTVTASGNVSINSEIKTTSGHTLFTAEGDVYINSGANIVTETGNTSLIGTNVSQEGGNITGLLNASATTGTVSLSQDGTYTLGVISSPSSVSVTSYEGAILDGNSIVNINVPTGSASLSAATGIGTLANPLETQVANITLASYGGDIAIINHGDLTLDALAFDSSAGTAGIYASTQFGAATGTLTIGNSISATGNVSLLGDTDVIVGNSVSTDGTLIVQALLGDVLVGSSVSTSGSLAMSAGGTLAVGANVSGNTVGLSGGTINIGDGGYVNGPAVGIGGSTVNVTSGGYVYGDNVGIGAATVNIAGGVVSASNLATVNANNLNVVDGGSLQALELDLTVGNLITVSGGGRIQADSPSTINILFPTLSSGGFLVNSVPGVVDPEDGGTGFFVFGDQVTSLTSPGFHVTYGALSNQFDPCALSPALCAPNSPPKDDRKDELLPSSGTSDTDVVGDATDKKNLPICK